MISERTRAVQIPEAFFSELALENQSKVYEFELTGGGKIKALFLKKFHVAVTLLKYRAEVGWYSHLRLWNIDFFDGFNVSNFCEIYNFGQPDFDIVAGPLYTQRWKSGRGHWLSEGLDVHARKKACERVFAKFRRHVERRIGEMYAVIDARGYWEAFQNPDKDYSKPRF